MKSLLHPHVNLVLSSLFIIMGTVWMSFNFVPASALETSPSGADISAHSSMAPSDLELETIQNIKDKDEDTLTPKETTAAVTPQEEPAIPAESPRLEAPVEEIVAPEPAQVQNIAVEKQVAVPEPAPLPVAPQVVAQVPVAAPVAPVTPVEQIPVYSDPNIRDIYVGLAGGQAVVDQCQGPVLFNAPLGYPYIAEHENCGGWARIGTLHPGMKVRLSGLVQGNYQVGTILNVNKGDTTDVLKFDMTPRAILQTCVPNTNRMIVVSLY